MEAVKYLVNQLYKSIEIRYRGTRNCALIMSQKNCFASFVFEMQGQLDFFFNGITT